MDDLIASSFRSKIGQEVVIRHRGRELTFVPKAVAGRNVSGKMELRAGRQVATFKIGSLTPDERSRWLGTADTHAKAAMKCILLMQAGDHLAARIFAASSGPMADALMQLAEAPSDRNESAGS
jgi:hypothetical protein